MSNEDPILDEEQTFAEEEEAWGSRKESNVGAGTFLGSVILVAGLGGGLVYMQYAGLQRFEAAQADEAIEVLDNDGIFGRARKAFNDAFVEVSDDAIATSKLALLEAQASCMMATPKPNPCAGARGSEWPRRAIRCPGAARLGGQQAGQGDR